MVLLLCLGGVAVEKLSLYSVFCVSYQPVDGVTEDDTPSNDFCNGTLSRWIHRLGTFLTHAR